MEKIKGYVVSVAVITFCISLVICYSVYENNKTERTYINQGYTTGTVAGAYGPVWMKREKNNVR